MTLLQQICSQMAESQAAQILFARGRDYWATETSGLHEQRLWWCADMLAVNFPAANDPVFNSPNAA